MIESPEKVKYSVNATFFCGAVSVDEAVFALCSQPRSGMLCSVLAFFNVLLLLLSDDGAAR